jgi:inner membrane protein
LDNLTHSLVGLTAAKAGLERLSPGATLLCVLAANSPDSDIVVLAFGDRWDFLQHHRGITHSIVGTAFLALLAPLIFYGIDRLWARLRHHAPRTNFRGLLIASLIVTATHPLMDWTNNYGIRFLLPWNPRWFYGDLVFIVDPFLWIVFGTAVFLASRTKVSNFIWGSAREQWRPRIAFAAFGIVLVYWGLLGFAHARAFARGIQEAQKIAAPKGETVLRLAAMPTLANPLRWDCVFETDHATYRFPIALNGTDPAGSVIRYPKPAGELAEALRTVSHEKPAHIFLGFARFPVARLSDPGCTTQTLVQLADLRYTEPGKSRGTFGLELPVECPDQALLGGR